MSGEPVHCMVNMATLSPIRGISKPTPGDECDPSSIGASEAGISLGSDYDGKSTSVSCVEDILVDNELLQLGVTCNITAVSLKNWGSARIGDNVLDDIAHPRKYLVDMIRSYKTGCNRVARDEPPMVLDSDVPLVSESDFAEYIRQFGELASSPRNLAEPHVPQEPSEEAHVSHEYFSESYLVQGNKVFSDGLDNIQESMAVLENQLSIVNSQLRELLHTRYMHVAQSFAHIDELREVYSAVHSRFVKHRNAFEQVKNLLLTTEANMATWGDVGSNSNDTTSTNYCMASALVARRNLAAVLSELQFLRAVAATPECIQAIAEAQSLDLVCIFYQCALEYFQTQLSKFTMTHAIANVIKDTLSNLVSVAEVKFVALASSLCVGLLQAKGQSTVESIYTQVKSLESTLIVLSLGGRAPGAMKSLASSSEVLFYSVQDHQEFQQVLYSLHIYGTLLVKMITCIELLRLDWKFAPAPQESKRLVQETLKEIQASIVTSGSCTTPSYSCTFSIAQQLGSLVDMPNTCKCNFNDHLNNVLVVKQQKTTSSGVPESNGISSNDTSDHEGKAVDGGPNGSKEGDIPSTSVDVDDADATEFEASGPPRMVDISAVSVCILNALKIAWNIGVASLHNCIDGLNFEMVYSNFEMHFERWTFILNMCEAGGKILLEQQRQALDMYKVLVMDEVKRHNFECGDICVNFSQTFEQSSVQLKSDIDHKLSLLARNLVNELHAECCLELHKIIESQPWEPPGDETSIVMDKMVSKYVYASIKMPQVGLLALSKAVDLFGHCFTLLDSQLSRAEENMGESFLPSCSMTKVVLDLTSKITAVTSEYACMISDFCESEQLQLVQGNAESCSIEGNSVYKRATHLVTNHLVTRMQQPMLEWLQDPHHSDTSKDSMDPFLATILECFKTTSQILTKGLLQGIFSQAFAALVKLVTNIKSQCTAPIDQLVDDTSRLVTELDVADLRLELCNFSNCLASELTTTE